MIKRFFLAAMAAMTLSLGFTSCGDDDDQVNVDTFKETYSVHYYSVGTTETEKALVRTTFNNALGVPDTTSIPKVTVIGKDSADCVAKLKAMLEPANAKVASMTFDEDAENSITIINSNNYPVVNRSLGVEENYSELRNVVRKFTTNANSEKYVYALRTAEDCNNPDEYIFSMDVNYRSGGGDIHIAARPYSSWYYRNAVCDVVVVNTHTAYTTSVPDDIIYNGRKYEQAGNCDNDFGSTESRRLYADLNRLIPFAPTLFLYFANSSDNNERKLLTEPLSICYKYKYVKGWFDSYYKATPDDFSETKKYRDMGYDVEFAPMLRYDSKTKQYVKESDCANLNEGGTGSQPLYFMCVYEK